MSFSPVELAGALAEVARRTLVHDFRRIDLTRSRVVLLEAGPRILPTFPADLSARAHRSLSRLGIQVLPGTPVLEVVAEGVRTAAGWIPAGNAFWAAGMEASPLSRSLGAPLDRQGRVLVREDLSLPGHPEVFVAGDMAALAGPDGAPLPAVAPAALQEGRWAADNLVQVLRHRPTRPFVYRHPGNLATVGRKAAVAELGRLHLWGTPAWLAWMAVHLVHLVGLENRQVVLLRWMWNYFTYQRAARLIIPGASDGCPPGSG